MKLDADPAVIESGSQFMLDIEFCFYLCQTVLRRDPSIVMSSISVFIPIMSVQIFSSNI